ncbi:MAG: DUF1643 domain-containing protein [Actinomycetaceae bacterium]|nr:DUF1643 domain-containing protein [Actinomycetaceae bacterium]
MSFVSDKITSKTTYYKPGFEPDFVIPEQYTAYRFALGKTGNNPLVAMCMNPSAAKDTSSDTTVNRIINVCQKLSLDGWAVFNLYPERATKAEKMEDFRQDLLDENLKIIRNYLIENNISEVWGAWGDNRWKIKALDEGKRQVQSMLSEMGIKIFYFGSLTRLGNPRHPIQRHETWDFTEKKYLVLG